MLVWKTVPVILLVILPFEGRAFFSPELNKTIFILNEKIPLACKYSWIGSWAKTNEEKQRKALTAGTGRMTRQFWPPVTSLELVWRWGQPHCCSQTPCPSLLFLSGFKSQVWFREMMSWPRWDHLEMYLGLDEQKAHLWKSVLVKNRWPGVLDYFWQFGKFRTKRITFEKKKKKELLLAQVHYRLCWGKKPYRSRAFSTLCFICEEGKNVTVKRWVTMGNRLLLCPQTGSTPSWRLAGMFHRGFRGSHCQARSIQTVITIFQKYPDRCHDKSNSGNFRMFSGKTK